MHRRNQKKARRNVRRMPCGVSKSDLASVVGFSYHENSGFSQRDLARFRPAVLRCAAALLRLAQHGQDQFEAAANSLLAHEYRRANDEDETFDPLQYVPEDWHDANSVAWRRGALIRVWQ